MRRWVPVLVLLAAAVFPASALADPPANDTQAGATALVPTYSYTDSVSPVSIPPTGTGRRLGRRDGHGRGSDDPAHVSRGDRIPFDVVLGVGQGGERPHRHPVVR